MSIQELGGLTPRAIRTHLGLNKPILPLDAAYGHFGRTAEGDFFPWEKTDLAETLKAALQGRTAVIASEAKQSSRPRSLDCFVASLLAMTVLQS